MSSCYGGTVGAILSGGTSCVAKLITGAVGGAAKSVAGDVFDGIATGFGNVARSVTTWLWQQVGNATSVDLTTGGVQRDLAATGALAGVIAVGLLSIQCISAVLRQDLAAIRRAATGTFVAFVFSVFAIAGTQLALAAVDQLSNGIMGLTMNTNAQGIGKRLVLASALNSLSGVPLFLISIVLIAASVVVWVALMVRKMLIIISAVFAPVAFSGAVSSFSAGWIRKWIEFTAALVFSKMILVVIFMIGVSVLNGAGQTGGGTNDLTGLAVGCLTLLLAGFAPWLAIKTVHFAGDAFHHVHTQAVAAQAGQQAVLGAPRKVVNTMAGADAVRTGGLKLLGNGTGNGGNTGQSGAAVTNGAGGAERKADTGSAGANGMRDVVTVGAAPRSVLDKAGTNGTDPHRQQGGST